MATYLIKVKYKDKNDAISDKIKWILLIAVDIVKDEIRNMNFSIDFYPTPTEIADLKVWIEWIQNSLYAILRTKINQYWSKYSSG